MPFTLELMEKAKKRNVEIVLPIDVVCAKEFKADSPHETFSWDKIPSDRIGLDIGPKTMELFTNKLNGSKTVVWNGPMGVFEFPEFAKGTLGIAKAVAAITQKGCISIVGGGDSVSAIKKTGLSNQISHISTGGGASLEVMEGKLLPGVAALNNE